MIDFIIFGIVDNGVMILGAFTGCEVEKYLPKRFQTGLGMVFGAGIGNSISDFLGGLASLNMPLAIGSGLGCLIGLALIPLFNKKFNVNKG
jgi:xanthine/uracil/vitamin C permease (AzgA family)